MHSLSGIWVLTLVIYSFIIVVTKMKTISLIFVIMNRNFIETNGESTRLSLFC